MRDKTTGRIRNLDGANKDDELLDPTVNADMLQSRDLSSSCCRQGRDYACVEGECVRRN